MKHSYVLDANGLWTSDRYLNAVVRALRKSIESEYGGSRKCLAPGPIPIITWDIEYAEKPARGIRLREGQWQIRNKPLFMKNTKWLKFLRLPRVLVPVSEYIVQPVPKRALDAFAMSHPALDPMMLPGIVVDSKLNTVAIVGVGKDSTGDLLPYVLPRDSWRRWLYPIFGGSDILRDRPDNDFIRYGAVSSLSADESIWTYSPEFKNLDDQSLENDDEERDFVNIPEKKKLSFQQSRQQFERFTHESRGRRLIARFSDCVSSQAPIAHADLSKIAKALEILLQSSGDLGSRLGKFCATLELHSLPGRKKNKELEIKEIISMLKLFAAEIGHEKPTSEALIALAKEQSSELDFEGRLRTLQRWRSRSSLFSKVPENICLL